VKLLNIDDNAKTVKGEVRGYLTGILYLAPSRESGILDTCPMSTPGCRASCLYTAGRASCFPAIIDARIAKTRWLARDRAGFMAQLTRDIQALERLAKRRRLIPCVRINGTSDMPQLAIAMAKRFPHVQFYDYTKIPRPWTRVLLNYHLTFSLSESNYQDSLECLQHGMNVAVVFHVRKGQPLPETWRGVPVIDGDLTDLRFLDAHRFGLIVGLRAKGQAKHDDTGFVQIVNSL
jgi:hypothetical protein